MHAAMRLTSIEFSFDPCNIYCDGVAAGYPADARSVGDSHPSCCLMRIEPGVELLWSTDLAAWLVKLLRLLLFQPFWKNALSITGNMPRDPVNEGYCQLSIW